MQTNVCKWKTFVCGTRAIGIDVSNWRFNYLRSERHFLTRPITLCFLLLSLPHTSESQRKRLAEFVYNGPTNCPQLTDCKFITKISAEEQRAKQFEKQFAEFKSRFSTDILQPWQADEINKLEKNLWIYFLTEPPKFLGAIQKIKRRASEKGAMTLKTAKMK